MIGSPRVLVLTASIGEGHERPARILAQGLRQECPGALVEVVDFLDVVGAFARRIVIEGSRFDSDWGNRLYDFEYRLIAEFKGTRRLAGALIGGLAEGPARRAVGTAAPDVVVSTYPAATEALGRLKAKGHLNVPVVATITDLAALRYWAHPALDLHLITHPEAAEEVSGIAPTSRVECVRGLAHSAFYEPRDRLEARLELGLPATGPLIAVSGGGWAVGDLIGATEESLRVEGASVVCLGGRNELVRTQLERRFGSDPRVAVLGFTEQMPDLLTASDVLVHSTAGGTVLEAIMIGCPIISYGWGRGHVRVNNEAYLREGLAEVAGTRDELHRALRRCMGMKRSCNLAKFAALPSAASSVLELARGSGRSLLEESPSRIVELGPIRDQFGDRRRRAEDRHANGERRDGTGEYNSPERGGVPALAADEWRQDHGNSDLDHEDRGRNAGGGGALKGGRFRDDTEDDHRAHEHDPGGARAPDPSRGILGDELADESRESVGSASADHQG